MDKKFTVGELRRLLKSVNNDEAIITVTLVSEDGAHHSFKLAGFEMVRPNPKSMTQFAPYLDFRIVR